MIKHFSGFLDNKVINFCCHGFQKGFQLSIVNGISPENGNEYLYQLAEKCGTETVLVP